MQSATKRSRSNPIHKWTKNEEVEILEYLKEIKRNGMQIEKPTAKIFYTNFKSQTPNFENIPVDSIKNKSHNLKRIYQSVKNNFNQTGQGILDENSTIMAKILFECPHYHDLVEIYGDKPNINVPVIFDSGLSEMGQVEYLYSDGIYNDDDDQANDRDINDVNEDSNKHPSPVCELAEYDEDSIPGSSNVLGSKSTTSKSITGNGFGKSNFNKRYEKNAVSKLSKIEESRQKLMEKKIKIEEQRMEQQQQIERDKLEFEKYKFEAGMKFQLEMRKIDKEERLALKEMEMKHKEHN